MEYDVNFPPLNEVINDKFIPYFYNTDKYLIFYGSRGSSKSDCMSKMLIYRLLSLSFFRCLSVRKTATSISESSYKMIVDNIYNMGLGNLFKITTSPLKIECLNGNYIIFRGLDEVDRLKSLTNICCLHFEEEVPDTVEEWNTLVLSIRSTLAEYIQIMVSMNPMLEDYENHYFWRMFFKGETRLTFRKSVQTENGFQYISVMHSTYHDNKWLSNDFKNQMETMRNSDPYSYQTQCLGLWANREVKGRFYMTFRPDKNCGDYYYNDRLPLHISFDFNVRPFSAALVFQITGRKIMLIDEVCITSVKEAPIVATCKEIMRRYSDHEGGIYIYGDATGRKDSTTTERGYNNYSIINKELSILMPSMRVPLSNPPVVMRGNFVNEIFANGYNGVELCVDRKCQNTVNDLLYTKMDDDGTIKKEMVKDKVTGLSWEKWGHLGDALGYMVIEAC